jgi:uncharacterized protein
MTTDTEAAKTFYGEVFGWTMTDEPVEGKTYTVLKAGDREVGGMMSTSAAMVGNPPPHWGVYVTVEDVEVSAKRAEELGAQMMIPPTDIPDVGRFCLFRDPQGAVLSMISYISN